ncbi:hypothetical protein AF335_03865 [Streptomyces eurocidicus]|uniref:DUF6879 domain-containing protein n=1 Tax=Streptomyces eurocidicus TaxID=66423 RepID=A0A2N8P382_STREU|nr:DUF6879 family protein [Streptomyces eurocidicus]MBB5117661.1 hypothetical protein [Streptomyces eurocidicus]MBF6053498.1 hypothetical protein [Streptomyces eurocidicus]PNE35474.1 hypothetical protein AF335_03865 [Streptomyces eurocidicus]
MSQSKQQPSFTELLESAQASAVHLEMRDAYGVGDEAEDFESWQRTGHRDVEPTSAYWAPWVDLIRRTVARGVVVRRARIVSEPVTEYIRFEHAGTPVNITAGEQVRWLPRRQTSDLALPGNDFWLFDSETVLFNHFSGDGDWSEPGWVVHNEPAVAQLAATAFEAVWERGIPHEKYTV